MEDIKNILFDLGGVILDLDRDSAVRRYKEIGLDSAEELLDPYHQKGVFLALEEGRVSKEAFHEEVRRISGKNLSDEDIDEALLRFITHTPTYKLEMLEQLRKKYKLYLLSNTNPVIMDWALSPDFPANGKILSDYFDKMYLSYKIGITKPDKRIFEYVIADTGLIPSETLYIDDGVANIAMGKALGMKTYCPKNKEDFRHIFGL
ncbi:MAG: HAD family phosphatase [Dysgonamonadaceae bacterium]|jgi:putative hydrolase of the HAD superfamily|nr:HAD family phosphatase [Dysgonamonadaceae bacterium]